MTEEKIQTYKPSVAREIRTAGQAKGLEGPALEEFVNKRLAAWEADQRKGVAR